MTQEMTPRVDDLMEFFYHASIAMVQTDLSGKVLLLNPVAAQMLMPMARRGDLLDNLFTTLDNAAPELRALAAQAPQRAGPIVSRHRIVLPSGVRGRSGPVFLDLSMVRLSSGMLMTTIEDVTESARQARLLQKEEAWINAMFAGASDHAQVLLDATGQIASWNDGMDRLTGFHATRMLGQPYSILFPSDGMTVERMNDRLIETGRNGLSIAETKMARADGSTFWGHSVITRASHGNGDGYALLLRDLSEHHKTIESLLKAASSDQLTGVGNRRALYEAAELEFARHARLPRDISLLLLDIDHFKSINDSFGHPVGDQVIRNLASVMLQSVRGIDTVARLGGEEFAVLLPSTGTEVAVRVAERIRHNVAAQQVASGEGPVSYRVSVGVAQVSPEIADIGALIMAADQALYEAKRQGRDRVCVRQAS